jgi:hypothetical protein
MKRRTKSESGIMPVHGRTRILSKYNVECAVLLTLATIGFLLISPLLALSATTC